MERLGGLQQLEDLLLVGNPLFNEFKENGALPMYRVEVGRAGVPPIARRSSSGRARGHSDHPPHALRRQVLKRVPTLKKLDGVPIDVEEREAAKAK